MRITTISVHHFRVIREAEVGELPMVCGIWGKNGSGKSALLHAVVAARNVQQFADARGFQTRGLQWDIRSVPWRGEPGRSRVVVTFEGNRIVRFEYEFPSNVMRDYGSNVDLAKVRYFPPARALVTREEQLANYSESDLAVAPRMVHGYLHWFLNRKLREKLETGKPNEFDRVNYWMARMGFGPVLDEGSADRAKAAFADEKTKFITPFMDGGFGGNVFSPLLLEAYSFVDGVLLVEEPEISLHPGAQADLFDFFLEMAVERNHQIIFTSHSEYMLRRFARYAAEKRPDEKLLGVLLARKEADGSHFDRVPLEPLAKRLEDRADLLPELHAR